MIRTSRGMIVLVTVVVVGLVVLGLIFSPVGSRSRKVLNAALDQVAGDTYTVDVTDYSAPKDDNDTLLVDDRLEDKKTVFDPSLVDSRPIEGWSVNASEAVIRLDSPMVKPDQNPELLVLHSSYLAAMKTAKAVVLPSVNMVDGKAKQFDDGLYAAIDQAYYLGHGDSMKSHLALIRRIQAKVAKGSPADDYLLGGLVVAGDPGQASSQAKMLAQRFLSIQVQSKPIGFYTWTKPLGDTFRVLRYFAQRIDDAAITTEIARVLEADTELRDDYRRAYTFYAKLTNPLVGSTPLNVIDGTAKRPVSMFPPSSTRETELFERLFPMGLTPNANLMRELITAVRSGKIDLKPRADGGWYDYQVHALETLLLPEKGAEANKLLLTKTYKKRMLEAFKAMITKRRETHARQVISAAPAAMPMPPKELQAVSPRLRVEPNPTYFLRTARSYAFLADFLGATLGESTLASLHGLREGGDRESDLNAELKRMRDLFYGLYLVSLEDIGMKPAFLDGETVDREAAVKAAQDWLKSINTDPDLAADTRVSIPVYADPATGQVRLWMTIGVRLAPLEAKYARGPKLRPVGGEDDWKSVEEWKLHAVHYVIPVDEFAEVELKGGRVLNRAELRAICDQFKTKEAILEALKK